MQHLWHLVQLHLSIVNAVSTLKQAKAKQGDLGAIDATNTGVGAILGSGMIRS